MTILPFGRFVDVDIEVRYSSELEKIAHKYDINASEIIIGLRLGFLQIYVQIDQHFTVHHADFVDNQVLTISPIFPLVAYFFLALFANWEIAGAMKSNARDVESGRASGGGNDQLILSIEHSKPCTDSSNQTTFSCATFSKHSQAQLRPDLASSKSMICNDTKDALLCFIQRELMNYIHNRRLVVCTISEENVRGFVCTVVARTSLLTGLSDGGGIGEPLRLLLKIGERKAKGIEVVWNRLRRW